MEYYIFGILLLLSVFWGAKISRTDEQKEILARFNNLRGVFAMLIVIGHCSMRFEHEPLPLLIIHRFNMVGVCFFLFISGWGLMYTYVQNGKTMQGFLKRKVISLLIMSAISSIITYIVMEGIINQNWDISKIFMYVINHTNWYIWEICIFYLMFYVLMRVCKEKSMVIISFITAMIICISTWCWGMERAFYFSALSFPVGMLFNQYWAHIMNLYHKRGFIVVSILIGCLSVGAAFTPQDSFYGGVVLRNFFGIMSIIILMMFVRCIPIGNRITLFLKKYSLEIYLYQFWALPFVKILFNRYNITINLIYVIAVCGVVLLVSLMMNKVNVLLKRRL